MNHFKAQRVATRVANFAMAESQFHRYADEGRPAVATAVDAFVSELGFAVADLAEAGMSSASREAQRILDNVRRTAMHSSALESEARTICHRIISELGRRKFLRVRNACYNFVDRDDLFGAVVMAKFKPAVADIKDAGNCLAAECSTAAVFHLMRVSEYGLRAVAKRLKVKLTHKKAAQPVEFADWNKIITGIKNKIEELRKLPSSPKQDKRLTFYSDIAEQSEYIKDVWRNAISHTRRSYNHDEAMGVKQRVQDFMSRIAAGPSA
jgi:hypothetical protein